MPAPSSLGYSFIGVGPVSAVGGTYAVYQASDGLMHLHLPGSDLVLQTSDLSPNRWQASDAGFVFVNTVVTDSSNKTHGAIYMFTATGARTNLSSAAGTSDDQLLSVHYPWAAWTTQSQASLVLYNVSSGQKFTILAPTGAQISGADFCIFNGQLTAFYTLGSTPGGQVNRWDQSSNTSVALGVATSAVRTDGVRAAWISAGNLTALNLAANTSQVVSSSLAGGFSLSNGILAWTDGSGAIKASDGTTTTTVSQTTGDVLYEASGGYVIFQEAGKILAWSPSGTRTAIFDPLPFQSDVGFVIPYGGGKTIYFQIVDTKDVGAGRYNRSIYSTTLP